PYACSRSHGAPSIVAPSGAQLSEPVPATTEVTPKPEMIATTPTRYRMEAPAFWLVGLNHSEFAIVARDSRSQCRLTLGRRIYEEVETLLRCHRRGHTAPVLSEFCRGPRSFRASQEF